MMSQVGVGKHILLPGMNARYFNVKCVLFFSVIFYACDNISAVSVSCDVSPFGMYHWFGVGRRQTVLAADSA